MEPDKRTYAEVRTVLAELMDQEHLSGTKLAKLAGVSHTMPWAILKGKSNASPTMLLKLAKGLATSNSGDVDQDKYARYAGALLRPMGFAPAVVDGKVSDTVAASVTDRGN